MKGVKKGEWPSAHWFKFLSSDWLGGWREYSKPIRSDPEFLSKLKWKSSVFLNWLKHQASSQAFDMECYEKKERSLVFLTKNWKFGKYCLELEVKLTENFHVLFFLHLTNPTITKEVQTSSMAFPYIYSLLNESFHFLFYICSFV